MYQMFQLKIALFRDFGCTVHDCCTYFLLVGFEVKLVLWIWTFQAVGVVLKPLGADCDQFFTLLLSLIHAYHAGSTI